MSNDYANWLLNAIRGAGIPVARLRFDDHDWMLGDDDVRVRERSYTAFRDYYRERGFRAPLCRWEMEDGRRFAGRPPVALTRTEWRGVLCGGERYSEDRRAMEAGLVAMIKRSHECGADEALPQD